MLQGRRLAGYYELSARHVLASAGAVLCDSPGSLVQGTEPIGRDLRLCHFCCGLGLFSRMIDWRTRQGRIACPELHAGTDTA